MFYCIRMESDCEGLIIWGQWELFAGALISPREGEIGLPQSACAVFYLTNFLHSPTLRLSV